jgi:hypothetical protein
MFQLKHISVPAGTLWKSRKTRKSVWDLVVGGLQVAEMMRVGRDIEEAAEKHGAEEKLCTPASGISSRGGEC